MLFAYLHLSGLSSQTERTTAVGAMYFWGRRMNVQIRHGLFWDEPEVTVKYWGNWVLLGHQADSGFGGHILLGETNSCPATIVDTPLIRPSIIWLQGISPWRITMRNAVRRPFWQVLLRDRLTYYGDVKRNRKLDWLSNGICQIPTNSKEGCLSLVCRQEDKRNTVRVTCY